MDNLIITWASESKIGEFKKNMMKNFEMIDLGLLYSYFGIEVHQSEFQIANGLLQWIIAMKIFQWIIAIQPRLQWRLI